MPIPSPEQAVALVKQARVLAVCFYAAVTAFALAVGAVWPGLDVNQAAGLIVTLFAVVLLAEGRVRALARLTVMLGGVNAALGGQCLELQAALEASNKQIAEYDAILSGEKKAEAGE